MHKGLTDNVHKYYTDPISLKPLLYNIMYILMYIKHFVIYYNIVIFNTKDCKSIYLRPLRPIS